MAGDGERVDPSGERPRSVFERKRRTTLAVVVVAAFCGADLLLAKALALTGLYELPHSREQHYRVRHPVYHHSLRPLVGFVLISFPVMEVLFWPPKPYSAFTGVCTRQ